MTMPSSAADPRRRLNLSIRESLIEEAREANFNLSRFLEEKLEQALREEKGRRWLEENRKALADYRARVEREGAWNQDMVSL
ncbi:type II toxin-antitoxin system CcdA family antitoxin [Solimonas soli]|uniref:type II toxin-antitoxin system CcdA family antitoxin n=1 Tax=Solimonas soli TaxID=413479 RepID=UPI0004874591|nr:type II toxin-antitoxin system CcdA family antitoxin [Solimonas soli]